MKRAISSLSNIYAHTGTNNTTKREDVILKRMKKILPLFCAVLALGLLAATLLAVLVSVLQSFTIAS